MGSEMCIRDSNSARDCPRDHAHGYARDCPHDDKHTQPAAQPQPHRGQTDPASTHAAPSAQTVTHAPLSHHQHPVQQKSQCDPFSSYKTPTHTHSTNTENTSQGYTRAHMLTCKKQKQKSKKKKNKKQKKLKKNSLLHNGRAKCTHHSTEQSMQNTQFSRRNSSPHPFGIHTSHTSSRTASLTNFSTTRSRTHSLERIPSHDLVSSRALFIIADLPPPTTYTPNRTPSPQSPVPVTIIPNAYDDYPDRIPNAKTACYISFATLFFTIGLLTWLWITTTK